MGGAARLIIFAAMVVAAHAAFAQQGPKSDLGVAIQPDAFAPEGETPALDEAFAPAPEGGHILRLQARLTPQGEPVSDGLIWRVFAGETDAAGDLQLIDTARGGSVTVPLAPGDYVVHVAFGRVAKTEPVTIGDADKSLDVVLNAGGLRLDATAGDGGIIPPERLSFDIMEDDSDAEGEDEAAALVQDAKPGMLIRLPAGTYHVISRYGEVNSIVRADITVTAGKLTEAVLRHDAAEVTLKLVSAEGGEALANPSWLVLTAGGDTVHESVGAFPSLVLAAGTYTAVASYQGEIYSREFKVESGVDHDVEVRLSDIVEPEPEGSFGEPEP
jgi:hypothetical protein